MNLPIKSLSLEGIRSLSMSFDNVFSNIKKIISSMGIEIKDISYDRDTSFSNKLRHIFLNNRDIGISGTIVVYEPFSYAQSYKNVLKDKYDSIIRPIVTDQYLPVSMSYTIKTNDDITHCITEVIIEVFLVARFIHNGL